MKDIVLKLMFNIQKNLHESHYDLPFLPEIKKVDKVKKLVANLSDIDMNTELRKKEKKMILKNISSNSEIIQFLENHRKR